MTTDVHEGVTKIVVIKIEIYYKTETVVCNILVTMPLLTMTMTMTMVMTMTMTKTMTMVMTMGIKMLIF